MPIVKVNAYKCNRCGYIWFPRYRDNDIGEPLEASSLPLACAKCKSEYWNEPRTLGVGPSKSYQELVAREGKTKKRKK